MSTNPGKKGKPAPWVKRQESARVAALYVYIREHHPEQTLLLSCSMEGADQASDAACATAGDRNTVRTVSAKPDGNSVVITAERYSHLKSYSSPFALLLTKDPTGAWKISAELTETRP